ncbi:MAG TPA: hypothetical protein VEV42_15735 [Pyrinomonadaceae bacterium]|nr:hypothetical protein [Pyrinomonadaceae bacterium]
MKDENLMRRLAGMSKEMGMTNKEIALDLLRRMPDNASLHEIAQRLEFIATIQQGLSELDDSGSISIEKIEPQLPPWGLTTVRKLKRRKVKNHATR